MKLLRAFALLICASALVRGQATLMPMPVLQFSDQYGAPLSGGQIYTCVTGSSCPGTPQATYTSQSGLTALSNPIVLNAAGEVTGQIWLGRGLVYRIVISDANGVVLNTIDPVVDNGAALSLASIVSNPVAFGAQSIAGPLSLGTYSFTAGKATFGGPTPWIDVTAPPYLASLNGIVDDTISFQNALNAAAGKAQSVYVPCVANPSVVISATLTLPSGVHFMTCFGGENQGQTGISGVRLKWTGPAGLPMIKAFDVNHSSVEGFRLDCNSVTSCIGVQYASDNAPSSSYFEINHVTVLNAHQAFVAGDPSNTPAVCASTPNALGCAQADSVKVHDFNVIGTGADATAEAIHLNDTNGLQSSEIELGNYQNVSYGVHIIASNGNLILKSLNGGNPVGAKTFILLEASLFVPPTFINDETEGSWTYAFLDHSGPNPGYQYQSTWINNSWNNPVLIDGSDHIVSIGNNGGNHSTIPWIAGGTSVVQSIGDNNENALHLGPWVPAGSGSVNTIGAINGAGGATFQGVLGAQFDDTVPTSTKGALFTRTGLHAGQLFFGDGTCSEAMTAAQAFVFNCGAGATFTFNGAGTTIAIPNLTASGLVSSAAFTANGNAGGTQVVNVRNSTNAGACTITYNSGLFVNSTCP